MFAEMGGHGSLEEDVDELEDVIATIDYDKLKMVQSYHPAIFVGICLKIFDYLHSLSTMKFVGSDGIEQRVNLYEKLMEQLIEKFINDDGSLPAWLEKILTIFEFARTILSVFVKNHKDEEEKPHTIVEILKNVDWNDAAFKQQPESFDIKDIIIIPQF